MELNQLNKITNLTDLSNVGVILLKDKSIQDIRESSGPLATNAEYQVHYWALVVRTIAPDGSIFDVAIPTVFYNYPQTVTGAHIDFDLNDVDDMSEQLGPVHNAAVNKLLASEQVKAIAEHLAATGEVTYLSVNLSSLHRHP